MSLDIWKFREIKECDHMRADMNWWGNVIDGDGQATCPDCGVSISFNIRATHFQYDGTEVDFVEESEFCDQCGEMTDPCEECRMCSGCANQKAVNRCDYCGEGTE